MKLTLTPSMKKMEQLFGPIDSIKPRNIWNPNDLMKILLGTLNYNIL